MEQILNFPYYSYPNILTSGYHETKIYNKELLRLYDTLAMYTKEPQEQFLFHLTIGAAMEEFMNFDDTLPYKFQWQQLFPIHLRDFLQHGGKVIHFIVSPTPSFYSETFIVPSFIEKTNKLYQWTNVDKNHYVSQDGKCDVYIFCTMMPHVDNRNAGIMTNLIKCQKNIPDVNLNIEKYLQTPQDVSFITEFYKRMSYMISNIISHNGVATCFSFAVFNEESCNGMIKDYTMFSEIKNVFIFSSKCLIAEWTFYSSNYLMSSSCFHDGISYIDSLAKQQCKGHYIIINDMAITMIPARHLESLNSQDYV